MWQDARTRREYWYEIESNTHSSQVLFADLKRCSRVGNLGRIGSMEASGFARWHLSDHVLLWLWLYGQFTGNAQFMLYTPGERGLLQRNLYKNHVRWTELSACVLHNGNYWSRHKPILFCALAPNGAVVRSTRREV